MLFSYYLFDGRNTTFYCVSGGIFGAHKTFPQPPYTRRKITIFDLHNIVPPSPGKNFTCDIFLG